MRKRKVGDIVRLNEKTIAVVVLDLDLRSYWPQWSLVRVETTDGGDLETDIFAEPSEEIFQEPDVV